MNYVSLTQISDNPFQSRRDYSDVEELAGRIAAAYDAHPSTYGLLQIPIGRLLNDENLLVKCAALDTGGAIPDAYRIELAFGHRRLRAFRFLSIYDERYAEYLMPIVITPMSDAEMLDAVWAENNERKDISAIERAELLQKKLNQLKPGGGTQRDVAAAWGMKRATVANELRLLSLPVAIRAANRNGTISGRQAHSLANVVKVAEIKENGQWDGGGWAAPISPEQLIQEVIAEPDQWSSNAIREVYKNQLEHAGELIPALFNRTEIGSMKIGATSTGLWQTACRGCDQRVNDYCFDAVCIAVKKATWGLDLAQQATVDLAYTLSTDEKHFHLASYQKRDAIVAIHAAGGCRHMRVGYEDSSYLVRPFTDGGGSSAYPTQTSKGTPYQKGDRSIVTLGHAGDPIKCLKAMNIVTEGEKAKEEKDAIEHHVPAASVRGARQEAVKRDGKKMVKRVSEALAVKLFDHFNGASRWAWDGLVALVKIADCSFNQEEHNDMETCRRLVKRSLSQTSYMTGNYAVDVYAGGRKLLKLAGLDPALADPVDPAEAEQMMLMRPLVMYYHNYQWMGGGWFLDRLMPHVSEALDRVEAYAKLNPNDTPGTETIALWEELDILDGHLQALKEANEEEE